MNIKGNNAISIDFHRAITTVENKFSQLADTFNSIKNSSETLLSGSKEKKDKNINKICGEFIQRISTKTINHEYEILDVKKLNNSGHISSKLTHKTLSKDVTELFCLLKNELLNQENKSLSLDEGHTDKSVNIILATLYQVYQQADEFFKKNICFGHSYLLKSQITKLINNNFTIESYEGTNPNRNDNAIELLKNMNKKYSNELNLYKKDEIKNRA